MAGTTRVRVRPGNQISHGGKLYKGGDEFDLPTRILPEFRWQVEEVGADGETREVRSVHLPGVEAPHERKAVLEQQLDAAKAEVARLESAIQAEDEAIAQGLEAAKAEAAELSDADQAQSDVNKAQTENMSGGQSKAAAADGGAQSQPAGNPNEPASPVTEAHGRSQAAADSRDAPVEHVDKAARGSKVVTEKK